MITLADTTVERINGMVEEIADLVARLGRRIPDDQPYVRHLVAKIGGRLESVHAILSPTAAELYRLNLEHCSDEDLAVTAALEDADAEAQRFRGLLGHDRDAAS